jgi:hypothetical protein
MRVVEEATRCNPIAERLKIAPLFRVRRYSKETSGTCELASMAASFSSVSDL